MDARTLPASKTNEALARKHTKAADAKHVMRQHLLCNLCVVTSIKECHQRKEMETIPNVVNLHSPTHGRAGAVDEKADRGMGVGGKGSWERGQFLYLEFAAGKQKRC